MAKKKIRFGLRSFLLVVTILAAILGVVGMRIHKSMQQKAAMDALTKSGAQYLQNEKQKVARIYLSGAQFDDKRIDELSRHLRHLPELHELDLVRTATIDKAIEPLTRLQQLEELYLFETGITEEGLATLQKSMPDVTIKTEEPDPIASSMLGATVYPHAMLAIAGTLNQQIVTGSGDGTARIWQVDSPQPIKTWQAHDNWVFDIASSSDGEMLVTGGGDNLVRLWDTASLKLLHEFTDSRDDVHDVAFAADDQLLIAASDDMAIRIWDLTSRKLVRTLEGHTRQIPRIAVSPDGSILASASRDTTVRLWEIATGKSLGVFHNHTADVLTVAFAPSGKFVASGDEDGKIHLYTPRTLELLQTLESHVGSVYDLAIAPGRDSIAVCGARGVQRSDIASNRSKLVSEQPYVSRVSFTAHQNFLATTNIAGELRLLHREKGELAILFRTMYGQRGLRTGVSQDTSASQ